MREVEIVFGAQTVIRGGEIEKLVGFDILNIIIVIFIYSCLLTITGSLLQKKLFTVTN